MPCRSRSRVSCLSTRATLRERLSLVNLLLISQSNEDMPGDHFRVCKRRKASSTTVEVLNFAADPESRTAASAREEFSAKLRHPTHGPTQPSGARSVCKMTKLWFSRDFVETRLCRKRCNMRCDRISSTMLSAIALTERNVRPYSVKECLRVRLCQNFNRQ